MGLMEAQDIIIHYQYFLLEQDRRDMVDVLEQSLKLISSAISELEDNL